MQTVETLTSQRLNDLLSRASSATIGLIGDVCLDAYWQADMRLSEISRETPHFPLPVVQERYSLGACGNVVANLRALGVAKLLPIMVIGRDWRGQLVQNLLDEKKINNGYIITEDTRVTSGYCKPYKMGISDVAYEDPRIDFINTKPISKEVEDIILAHLGDIASKVDLLCVADQVSLGCITPRVKEKICNLARQGLPVIADSRNNAGSFKYVLTKPNEVELSRIVPVSEGSLEAYAEAAVALAKHNQAPVCCTLGSKGCIIANNCTATYVPAHPVEPPIDICGAGDAFFAAFAAAMSARATMEEAAQIAVLAAAVTIKKIGETGTATTEDILERKQVV